MFCLCTKTAAGECRHFRLRSTAAVAVGRQRAVHVQWAAPRTEPVTFVLFKFHSKLNAMTALTISIDRSCDLTTWAGSEVLPVWNGRCMLLPRSLTAYQPRHAKSFYFEVLLFAPRYTHHIWARHGRSLGTLPSTKVASSMMHVALQHFIGT
jgi:hypothetical protein